MLVTLVIGLREGLEAVLIVSIVSVFLRRAGASLRPMWIGVAGAVLLSAAVGVGLELVSESLNQSAQEAMEAVIGAVAVITVSVMILWMHEHSRSMKHDLEAAAGQALSQGSTWALAGMAFLAVLREGFETAVFLLAAFQSSSSPLATGLGAAIGIGAAVLLGFGLAKGALRLNLSRLFRGSAVFLVLVAAGLVFQCLRHCHEAGWLNIGQQRVADLTWLAPHGSIRAALFTGVLGIEPDPRLVEVLGWAYFLVPMLVFVLWPPRRKVGAATATRLRLAGAGLAALVAVGLAVGTPAAAAADPGAAAVVADDDSALGTVALTSLTDGDGVELTYTPADGTTPVVTELTGAGEAVDSAERTVLHWSVSSTADLDQAATSLTLADLVTLGGGRVPVGVRPDEQPGPYDAVWESATTTEVWTVDGLLYDATSTTRTVVTISGGGLDASRTVTVDLTDPEVSALASTSQTTDTLVSSPTWSVAETYPDSVVAALDAADKQARERRLWSVAHPIGLGVLAVVLATRGLTAAGGPLRRRREQQAAPEPAAEPAAEEPPLPSHQS